MHSAHLELEKSKDEQGLVDDEVAWRYTHAIIDWVTAVIAGYMLKPLKDGDPGGFTEEGGAELVREWIRRAKEVYFVHFRGEMVSMGSFMFGCGGDEVDRQMGSVFGLKGDSSG